MAPPGGERPGAVAADYNDRVTDFLESMSPSARAGRPYWSLLASAQDSPRMTSYRGSGREVHFDLVFHHRPEDGESSHRYLVVETKASYDQHYIDREFAGFLKDVLEVVRNLSSNPGEDHCFSYVSPVGPSVAVNPQFWRRSADISRIYSTSCEVDLSPEDLDLLRGRVMSLQISDETLAFLGLT